jgi:choline dehydrogenase-like flavoprotein
MTPASTDDYDYVVVGSGAGGGTVAARLAEAGMRVLLLEAGSDSCDPASRDPELPNQYQVPAFHPFASENPAMAWNFRVHDFGEDASRRLPRENPPAGVLYPRASALGGCTAHNAMIFMYPHDSDWDQIAALTGDRSWSAGNMRRYFHLLENCRHRPLWRFLSWLNGGRFNPTGHGWKGWLDAEIPLPRKAFGDRALMRVIRDTIRSDIQPEQRTTVAAWLRRTWLRLARLLIGESDPNDQRLQGSLAEGLCEIPLSTSTGRRRGARERVLSAVQTHGLDVEFDALVTRVLLDADKRAIGVEFLKGKALYRASPNATGEPGVPRSVRVAREVILAGGSFNTPQLLMLSGIGPPAALTALGIDVNVPLEGVGQNLQDRYEIGLVHKTLRPWSCLRDAHFAADDPVYRDWLAGRGMYISNGAAVAFALRSSLNQANPDLFVMALLTRFSGYFPGYSDLIRNSHDYLTFALLKAHTNNRGGIVSLKSSDPRDPPQIDFRYFEEGTDRVGDDLAAVVAGIRRVRKMSAELQACGLIHGEDTPGADLQDDEQLRQFIRTHAWGHHACGTCAIGHRDAGGVLSSDFRVHGTSGIRVVDASVFPRIPGFFIACAVYMIGEKAAEAILETARTMPRRSTRQNSGGIHA